jgi:hypothetical protein
MPGGWQTYRCDSCPLIIELGGTTLWDEHGVVFEEGFQVVCAGCGTLHRLTERDGICRVTALPGPIRAARTVTLIDIAGEPVEIEQWFAEADWQPRGEHAGGINGLAQFACTHCSQVGKMLTYDVFRYPGGDSRSRERLEKCPLCHGPTECIAVTDAV